MDELKAAKALDTYVTWKENVSFCLLSPLLYGHNIPDLKS